MAAAPSRIRLDLIDKPPKSLFLKEYGAKEWRAISEAALSNVPDISLLPQAHSLLPVWLQKLVCAPGAGQVSDQGSLGWVLYTSGGKWTERLELTFVGLEKDRNKSPHNFCTETSLYPELHVVP